MRFLPPKNAHNWRNIGNTGNTGNNEVFPFFVVGNNGNIGNKGNNDFFPRNLSTINALFIILDVRPFHFSCFNFGHISFLLGGLSSSTAVRLPSLAASILAKNWAPSFLLMFASQKLCHNWLKFRTRTQRKKWKWQQLVFLVLEPIRFGMERDRQFFPSSWFHVSFWTGDMPSLQFGLVHARITLHAWQWQKIIVPFSSLLLSRLFKV